MFFPLALGFTLGLPLLISNNLIAAVRLLASLLLGFIV